MAKSTKAPYKLMVCIIDKDKAELAWKVLQNAHESFSISNMVESVHGTAFMDIIGLGRAPRIMITGLVRSDNASRVLQGLDLVMNMDDSNSGIAFTVKLSAIGRDALNYFATKQGGEI